MYIYTYTYIYIYYPPPYPSKTVACDADTSHASLRQLAKT